MFASEISHPTFRGHAATIADWHHSAWRILAAAPLGVLLVSVLPMLFEAAIQLSMPAGTGVLLSKLLTPIAGALALAALHLRVERKRWLPLQALHLLRTRWTALPWIVAFSLAVFCMQLAVAALLSGPQDAFALLRGDGAALQMDGRILGRVFATGVVPVLLFLFVSPLLLLDGHRLVPALRANFVTLRRHAAAVLLIGIVLGALLMFAVVKPVLLLPLLVYGSLITYAAWREAFHPLGRHAA